VPEVGLELHSDPRKQSEPAKTYGIRPNPTARNRSEPKSVDNVHTPKSAQDTSNGSGQEFGSIRTFGP